MGHEEMADFIEVEPPLVAAAMGEDLKLMPLGMVAPHGAAHRHGFHHVAHGLGCNLVGLFAVAGSHLSG